MHMLGIRNKVVIAVFLVLGYLSMSLFSLMPSTHTRAMQDCPYSPGSSSMCDMGQEHVAGWWSVTNTLVTKIFFLLILAIVLFTFVREDYLIQARYRKRPERQYSLYVHLFSQGILHPKLF